MGQNKNKSSTEYMEKKRGSMTDKDKQQQIANEDYDEPSARTDIRNVREEALDPKEWAMRARSDDMLY